MISEMTDRFGLFGLSHATYKQFKQQKLRNTRPNNLGPNPLTSKWDKPMEQTNAFSGF